MECIINILTKCGVRQIVSLELESDVKRGKRFIVTEWFEFNTDFPSKFCMKREPVAYFIIDEEFYDDYMSNAEYQFDKIIVDKEVDNCSYPFENYRNCNSFDYKTRMSEYFMI